MPLSSIINIAACFTLLSLSPLPFQLELIWRMKTSSHLSFETLYQVLFLSYFTKSSLCLSSYLLRCRPYSRKGRGVVKPIGQYRILSIVLWSCHASMRERTRQVRIFGRRLQGELRSEAGVYKQSDAKGTDIRLNLMSLRLEIWRITNTTKCLHHFLVI